MAFTLTKILDVPLCTSNHTRSKIIVVVKVKHLYVAEWSTVQVSFSYFQQVSNKSCTKCLRNLKFELYFHKGNVMMHWILLPLSNDFYPQLFTQKYYKSPVQTEPELRT